jgi:dTDP-4-dehydrorhamnose 3,5-epimerase
MTLHSAKSGCYEPGAQKLAHRLPLLARVVPKEYKYLATTGPRPLGSDFTFEQAGRLKGDRDLAENVEALVSAFAHLAEPGKTHMIATPTAIPDVLILEPQVFGDDRGFFFESFNARAFAQASGLKPQFVQDNHSKSARNVLRGLHYQLAPKAQGKLLRVVKGEVFDVAVDLRNSSKTFGCWVGLVLSAKNKQQLWIPPGFAHGFLTLSEGAEFLYKTTEYYSPDHERSLLWNDPALGIDWPLDGVPILAAKDATAKRLSEAETFS